MTDINKYFSWNQKYFSVSVKVLPEVKPSYPTNTFNFVSKQTCVATQPSHFLEYFAESKWVDVELCKNFPLTTLSRLMLSFIDGVLIIFNDSKLHTGIIELAEKS